MFLVSGLAVLALVLVVLASPRHRTFYFRWADPRPVLNTAAIVSVVRGATAAPAAIVTRRQTLVPDGEGLKVPMTDEPPLRLPLEGVPAGWELHEFAGTADVTVVRGQRGPAVQLRSARSSFALHRDLVVSLEEFPILTWSWKVDRLPAEGDVRQASRDDQAAQVYVVFPHWPAPRTQSEVIGYVWDTTTPVGTTLTSRKSPNVKIVVVESGPAHLGSWQVQKRDVAADFQKLFGRRAPRVGTIAIMIDSNDTGTDAAATIADLTFARATAKE